MASACASVPNDAICVFTLARVVFLGDHPSRACKTDKRASPRTRHVSSQIPLFCSFCAVLTDRIEARGWFRPHSGGEQSLSVSLLVLSETSGSFFFFFFFFTFCCFVVVGITKIKVLSLGMAIPAWVRV